MKRTITSMLSGGLLAAAVLAGGTAASATSSGAQGCTPGYWKNHTYNWPQAPGDGDALGRYTTTRKVSTVFANSGVHANTTLLDALSLQGGSTLDGARGILLRAATAAVLNADHEGLGYPLRRPVFIPLVNTALGGTSRSAMISLASRLDTANNLGCPLSNKVWTPTSRT
jgi:hypothetical protein